MIVLLYIMLCFNASLAADVVQEEEKAAFTVRPVAADDVSSLHKILGNFNVMQYVEYSDVAGGTVTASTRGDFAKNLRAAMESGEFSKFDDDPLYRMIASQTVEQLEEGYDKDDEGTLGYVLEQGRQATFLLSETPLSKKYLGMVRSSDREKLPSSQDLFYTILAHGSGGSFAYPLFRTKSRTEGWAKSGQLIACGEDDRVVAFMSTSVSDSPERERGCISVVVGVLEDFQRQGVAKLLWRHTLESHKEWLTNPRGYDVHVTANVSNEATIGFMSRFSEGIPATGFGPAKRLEWYIPLEDVMAAVS